MIYSLLVATALGRLLLLLQLDTMFHKKLPAANLTPLKQKREMHTDGVKSTERSWQVYLLGLSSLSQTHNTTTKHLLEK
jgi:hypothetical protein